MTKGQKNVLIGVVAVLLMVGIAAVFGSQLAQLAFPGTGGVAAASSPLTRAGAKPGTNELDAMLLKLDEAWKASDWTESIAAIEAIEAMDPGNAAMKARLAQAHTNQGWVLLADRHLEEARDHFTRALDIRPAAAEAQEGLRLLQQLTLVESGGGPPTVVAVPEVVVTPVPQVVAPVQVVATPVVQVAAVCVPQVVQVCPPVVVQVCPTVCPPVVVQVCPTVCPPVVVEVRPTVCPAVVVEAVPTVCPTVLAQVAAAKVAVKVHVVQRGENLFRLAAQFETTVSAIMQANGLTTTTIRVGQTLIIP